MKYNRFLPLIIPIAILAISEIYFFNNSLIYASLVISFLLIFFAIRQFIIAGNSSEVWYNFFISPAMLYGSLIFFTTFIVGKSFVQLTIFASIILLYVYLRMLYVYLVNFNLRQHDGLENFSSYGNFLAFYALSSSLYGIRSFLNFPVWPLMIIFLIAAVLLVYQNFWINGAKFKMNSFYTLIIALVLTELAWSITFLTLSFYILGLIISVCYYILVGITRFYLKNDLDNKVIKWYLIFGLLSIFVVLLSARWFEI